MRIFVEHKRVSLTVVVLGFSLLAGEEMRYGRILGLARFPCELFGGKFASAQSRCVTRACAWFDDCGYWASPGRWRDRVAPGDSISTVIFWLGEPNGPKKGDAYFWAYEKGGGERRFAANFRDGRFVDWTDDAIALRTTDITIQQARAIALNYLTSAGRGDDIVLVPGSEREAAFGWVFFGAPKKYIQTGDVRYEIPSMGPLVVGRDGSVHPLSTSGTPDSVIAAYLQQWQKRQQH